MLWIWHGMSEKLFDPNEFMFILNPTQHWAYAKRTLIRFQPKQTSQHPWLKRLIESSKEHLFMSAEGKKLRAKYLQDLSNSAYY